MLRIADIFRQARLPREALVHFTRILEQHGIDQLGTDRDLFAFQDEIRHTRPTALRGNVYTFQAQVAILECIGFGEALHSYGMVVGVS